MTGLQWEWLHTTMVICAALSSALTECAPSLPPNWAPGVRAVTSVLTMLVAVFGVISRSAARGRNQVLVDTTTRGDR